MRIGVIVYPLSSQLSSCCGMQEALAMLGAYSAPGVDTIFPTWQQACRCTNVYLPLSATLLLVIIYLVEKTLSCVICAGPPCTPLSHAWASQCDLVHRDNIAVRSAESRLCHPRKFHAQGCCAYQGPARPIAVKLQVGNKIG